MSPVKSDARAGEHTDRKYRRHHGEPHAGGSEGRRRGPADRREGFGERRDARGRLAAAEMAALRLRAVFRGCNAPRPLADETMHAPALAVAGDQMKTAEGLLCIGAGTAGFEKRNARVLGGEAGGDGTIEAKVDAQRGSHPIVLLSIRARHGRRTPAYSFRSTRPCTGSDASPDRARGSGVTPKQSISRGRRCRRPPSPKKRIDPTCSGAVLRACRSSQGRPPASRSCRRGHI